MPETAGARRLAAGVEYDGTHYHGWQDQPHASSVQACLNQAFSRVADEAISTVTAGRTDAGVHARGQVVHFDTSADRSARSWLLGANSNLPDDINVVWVKPVTGDFHARYSALSRSYRYRILNRPVRSALHRDRAWWVREPLDADAMQVAARHLLGKHDFSAFRASACQANTPVRTMQRLEVQREGSWVSIECTANAFLHHMVRNLAGTLVRVGLGERSPGWVAEVLAGRDRTRSGMTAPAAGLTLERVDYPPDFGLPEFPED